jgi:hypothetical protein
MAFGANVKRGSLVAFAPYYRKIVATADNHYANLWCSILEKGAYMARGLHS